MRTSIVSVLPVNPPGPDHVYAYPGVPPVTTAVNCESSLRHSEPLKSIETDTEGVTVIVPVLAEGQLSAEVW